MSRQLICGWEVGDTSSTGDYYNSAEGGIVGGGCSIDTSIYRSGAKSLKIAHTGSAGRWKGPGYGTLSGPYIRIYLRVTSLPGGSCYIAGASTSFNIRLTSAGNLALYNYTTLIGTSTTALTDSAKWYCVEFRTSGTSTTLLRIDGNNEVTGSISGTFAFCFGSDTNTSYSYTIYIDDLVIDAAEWPGADSKVITYALSSDSLNTAWTRGAGGTSNLYDGVNAMPPAGVASANETNDTNIECASKSTNSYLASFPSYTTMGIGSSDTVKSVQVCCVSGEDISTGTKTFDWDTTNPVMSYSGETAGGDLGAHSDYPGVWSGHWLNSSTDPSVTKGTAPTIVFEKTDGTSRTLCICAVYISVEYTVPSGQQETQDVAGTVTVTGTLSNQVKRVKALSGTVASTAVFSRVATLYRSYSGTTGPTATTQKKVNKSFAGSITITAILNIAKAMLLSVAGTVASTAILVKKVNKSFAGSIALVATIQKQIKKAFDGTVALVGAAAKRLFLSTVGTVASTAILVKKINKSFAGSTTVTAILQKQIKKAFSGAITLVGTLAKKLNLSFAGTVALTATLTKKINKAFDGVIALTATLTKAATYKRAFDGTVAAIATLGKKINKAFAGATGPTATLAILKCKILDLVGAVIHTATLGKRVNKGLSATPTVTGSVQKQITKQPFTGVVYPTGGAFKKFPKSWDGIVALTANVVNSPTYRTRGQVSFGELEIPTAPTRGQVSWAELETPESTTTPTRGQVSFSELEIPNVVTRAQVSFAELETPSIATRALISWVEFEVANLLTRGQVSWAEFEVGLLPTRSQVSFAEFEVPTAPTRCYISWSCLEIMSDSETRFWCAHTGVSAISGGGDIEGLQL